MELYQLRQFQSAARHKNMTRAAGELSISLKKNLAHSFLSVIKKGSNVPVREKFCLNMQTEYWLFQKMLRVLSVKVLAMQAK